MSWRARSACQATGAHDRCGTSSPGSIRTPGRGGPRPRDPHRSRRAAPRRRAGGLLSLRGPPSSRGWSDSQRWPPPSSSTRGPRRVRQEPCNAGERRRSETSTRGTASKKPAAEPKETTGPAITFQRLRGTNGRGTAQLIGQGDGARVRLRVTSLLRPVGGGYAVWLFNSTEDARPLSSTRARTLKTDLSLPPDYHRFRYIEVSREPTDDPSHSGLSLLRAPLDKLAPPPD